MNLQLSKTIAHALRHAPEAYGIQLDEAGWVGIPDLLEALRKRGFQAGLTDLEAILEQSSKKRFEIKDNRIRAFYGHSVESKIAKTPTLPPQILYHGTSKSVLPEILDKGLLPMNRQYVHLSKDRETAEIVARRRKGPIVILTVAAQKAAQSGVIFYEENNGIWLSEPVPPPFLSLD